MIRRMVSVSVVVVSVSSSDSMWNVECEVLFRVLLNCCFSV